MPQIDLGKIRFAWKGGWVESTSYALNDVVGDSGAVYVYINEAASAGNLVSNTTYWAKMIDSLSSYALVAALDVTGDLNVGPDAAALRPSLTHPTIVVTENAPDYAQIAFQNQNSGVNASTDYIAYADNGTDDAGYIDMGITSSTFSDPLFTITGENDGYIFMTAPTGSTGNGDLVLATGDTGARNAIVFAAGGLASDNTQMTITPDQSVHIAIPTPSTSPTTGALVVTGGVGIQGDMNIQGNVDIEGTITFGGAGTTVETANLTVTDPMVFVGSGNTADIVDLAFVGEYKTGGVTKYAGIARDASDGIVKIFKDATTKPTSTVDFSEVGLAYGDLKLNALDASSITVGNVSNTEIGYLDGVTSGIQSQLDLKAPLTGAALTRPVLTSAFETVSASATAATGTVNVDVKTSAVKYYTSAATANWTFNFRGDGSTTLDSMLATGQSATVAFMVTNGTTAYRPTVFQIDGTAVTPKWQGGSAPSSGNASAVDSYVFTIIKTGAATFSVFASQTKFA